MPLPVFLLLVAAGVVMWLTGSRLRRKMRTRLDKSPLLHLLTNNELGSYMWRCRLQSGGWLVAISAWAVYQVMETHSWGGLLIPSVFGYLLVKQSYRNAIAPANLHLGLLAGIGSAASIVLTLKSYFEQGGLAGVELVRGNDPRVVHLRGGGQTFELQLMLGQTWLDVEGHVLANFALPVHNLMVEVRNGAPVVTTALQPRSGNVT
jgi:hypothetical protein